MPGDDLHGRLPIHAAYGPAPTHSTLHACSIDRALSIFERVAGCDLQQGPFDLSGSSAKESARENSAC